MKRFFLPLLALALLLSGLSGLSIGSNASAFSGAFQDLPYCADDPTSGLSMPTNFPSLDSTEADYAYGAIPRFDPETSSYVIGYDSEFWYSGYDTGGWEKLFIWYTDKDSTNSGIRLDYDVSTSQSSVGLYNDASGTPQNGVYYAILQTTIEGTRFVDVGSSSAEAWGQRSAISCYEYQQSINPIDYTTSYSENYDPIDEGGGAGDKEIRRPNFTYQLNDKVIKATPYSPEPSLPDFTTELDEGYSFVGYFINWQIWQCPGDWDSVTGTCSEALVDTDTAFVPVDEEYQFTVSDYGKYQIEAEYWAEQCYRYPSYPATPDYCFRSQLRAHFNDQDFDYVNTYKNLVVDGRTTTGDTRAELCTVGGYCQPTTAVCYTIDSFIERLNCEMSGQLSTGLLNPSLEAVKTLIASVVVPTNPTCSVPLPNPVIDGKTLNLSSMGSNMCSGANTIRTNLPAIPIVLNAVFAWAILAYIIHKINRLLDNNKTDVLEKV